MIRSFISQNRCPSKINLFKSARTAESTRNVCLTILDYNSGSCEWDFWGKDDYHLSKILRITGFIAFNGSIGRTCPLQTFNALERFNVKKTARRFFTTFNDSCRIPVSRSRHLIISQILTSRVNYLEPFDRERTNKRVKKEKKTDFDPVSEADYCERARVLWIVHDTWSSW